MKRREAPLTENFIGRRADCIGKIETAQTRLHREAKTAVGILQKKFFRQSCRFFAEKQIAGIGKVTVGIDGAPFGSKEEILTRITGKEIVKIFILGDIEILPVIETRTLEFFVINGKAHRFHDMKPRSRGGAGAGNVAGILRDLRLDQNKIDSCHTMFLSFKNSG